MTRPLIDTPRGVRETVEQTLQAYGGVLAEHQPPAAGLVDPVQAYHLRQHLEGASTALRLTYDVSLQSEPLDVLLPRRLRSGCAICANSWATLCRICRCAPARLHMPGRSPMMIGEATASSS